MTCEEFRALFERVGAVPPYEPGGDIRGSWYRHRSGCSACAIWSRLRYCELRGIVPAHHCCLDMAHAISGPVLTAHQGPNEPIIWLASCNEYRIPIPITGYSSTLIRFCPFCGRELPESRCDEWYEKLRAMGYNDPCEDEIPKDFESDAWWRK